MLRNLVVSAIIFLVFVGAHCIDLYVSNLRNVEVKYLNDGGRCIIEARNEGVWVEKSLKFYAKLFTGSESFFFDSNGRSFLSVELCRSFENGGVAIARNRGAKIILSVSKRSIPPTRDSDHVKDLAQLILDGYLNTKCPNEGEKLNASECSWSEMGDGGGEELVMFCYWPSILDRKLNISPFQHERGFDVFKPLFVGDQPPRQCQKLDLFFHNDTAVYGELYFVGPHERWTTSCLDVPLVIGPDSRGKNLKDYTRAVLNQGTHRKLQTRFSFSEGVLGRYINVIDVLPKDVYLNEDEIKEVERFGGPRVLLFSKMDLEGPAVTSRQNLVWAIREIRHGEELMEIPIHLRYQAPSPDEKYANITISAPMMSWISDSMTTKKSISEVEFFSLIDWSHFEGITVQFPMGELKDRRLVVIVTRLVTTLGFLALILAVIRGP